MLENVLYALETSTKHNSEETVSCLALGIIGFRASQALMLYRRGKSGTDRYPVRLHLSPRLRVYTVSGVMWRCFLELLSRNAMCESSRSATAMAIPKLRFAHR